MLILIYHFAFAQNNNFFMEIILCYVADISMWKEQALFMRVSQATLRTIRPNIGMFVLILIFDMGTIFVNSEFFGNKNDEKMKVSTGANIKT